MAEVDTNLLSNEHGAIRHDIAVESARLGGQMGAESCNIRGAIGDVRREGAEHTADIRYNLAERSGDIRRELADVKDVLNDSTRVEGGATRMQAAQDTGEIIKEGLKSSAVTDAQIKDSRYEISSRVENAADRADRNFAALADRFFTVSRDTADLRAQVIQAIDTTKMSTELNALKGIIEGQKNTQYLSDKITHDGEKTRDLISDLKYHDLNRALVERNSELVEEREGRRHWRHAADQNQYQGQWAAVQSQLQAFASQLQETRQGMVNFGTMSGQSGQQSSTSNNVR